MQNSNPSIEENPIFLINNSNTSNTSLWSYPVRVDVIEKPDSIEIIYKERLLILNTPHTTVCSNMIHRPQERVFKIVFSCIEGKWNKSDRIYGRIIQATQETYEF